ncbi:MAG: hypothetical protein KAX49_17930 [Halanaerobiales bacterium]|nr:hypothetical protein [Halanaerobiales bacterium]
MVKLKRLTLKPILSPIKVHDWEKEAVFNCAAMYEDNMFHLFYRASNNSFLLNTEKPEEEKKFISSIGYAVSEDGINFTRFEKPIFKGETEQEAWGVEDPRITKIDDTYYMLYTGFGGKTWDNYKICMACSKDMKNWGEHRILLDESNKDAALLTEKVNGKYILFHRRIPDIWVAYSDNLKDWTNHKIVMKPIKNTWESEKVGIAGPPIKREDGWLLFYHAVDDKNVYRLGAALLDLEDISKVIVRLPEPILEPELEWEVNGLVPNVVFSCGAVEVNGKYYVYYGGADTHIGVAVIEKDKIQF